MGEILKQRLREKYLDFLLLLNQYSLYVNQYNQRTEIYNVVETTVLFDLYDEDNMLRAIDRQLQIIDELGHLTRTLNNLQNQLDHKEDEMHAIYIESIYNEHFENEQDIEEDENNEEK